MPGRAIMDATLRPYDLGSAQWFVLWHLATVGPAMPLIVRGGSGNFMLIAGRVHLAGPPRSHAAWQTRLTSKDAPGWVR